MSINLVEALKAAQTLQEQKAVIAEYNKGTKSEKKIDESDVTNLLYNRKTRFIGKNGYVMIKLEDGSWKPEHRVVWERVNGPLPPGWIVKFRDNNRLNTNPDNLLARPRNPKRDLNVNALEKRVTELEEKIVGYEGMITELKQGLDSVMDLVIGK